MLHVSRQPEAFGSSNDDYAEVGRLWSWTIDLDAGTVTEEQIDDRPGDFGRVDDRLVGLDARYGYLMAMAGEGNSRGARLRLGAVEVRPAHAARARSTSSVTACAVPSRCSRRPSPDAGEDEGWVISLAHDTNSDESRLIIIDAQNFSAPPVATIHLPRRVPYGAHGSWVPDSTIT